MIKYFILLLVLFPMGFLCAQRTVIAGKFPYQRDVPFSVAFISNQVVLMQEWGKVADTSNAQGLFHLELKVDKPSIIRFTQRENVELYIRPGDSLWIEMINGRNVSFAGTAGRENNLLFSLNRPFIPIETQENPQEYSALIDTLYQKQREGLKAYQAEQADEGFVSLFTAKAQAQFLEDKIRVLQFMQKEAWEGALKDRVERQIRNLPLVDEVRAEVYINALHHLFTLEVQQIMGIDWSANERNAEIAYPAGYQEVFRRHWQERLAELPKLKQYFEIEEWVQNIQYCSKLENLPQAAADLERIKQVKDYLALHQEMELAYRKKVILLKMKKLPAMAWQTASGQIGGLDPASDQRTLVVFWDANQAESVEAYRKFQEKTSIQFLGRLQDSVLNTINRQKMIWVQVGGDLSKWKQVIGEIPAIYRTEHYLMKEIGALQPYLYADKLPIAFALKADQTIESISNRPTAIDVPSWVVETVGGRVIWKRQKE
ncbi:MAG: hypothetical protein SFV55_13285 [Haliscomenobacter sp.]|uniref:hypothetical protein n=1 Tax=Haliscomenobacter sp. TaxID=2717303 RepID=UPI0029ADFF00|nr:hypothetical protein [Haliscomenobacter sp.]MDX2069393.1 hypothetical protein [Haliscomenobacter sp.]